MRKVKDIIATILPIIVVIGVTIGLIAGVIWVGNSVAGRHTTHEYALSELQDGVYGIHVVSTSAIPAQNFEMVTVNINGQIYTIKGDINVYYTDGIPKIVWIDYNLVNGDVASLYVPEGTVRYDGVVTVE